MLFQWCAPANLGRQLFIAALVGTLSALSAAAGTIPGFGTGQIPSLAPILREITPAVVNVSVRGMVKEDNPLYQDPYFRQFFDLPKQLERRVEATGSGVIVDSEHGYALTNNHVVEHAANIQVATKDGQNFSARIVGRDPATDIAVIQIRNGSHLKALSMGDSDNLEVGDFVIAIGNPFGLGQTVTSGIISALGRSGLGIEGYEDFIQTDASINPGNSGGALANLRGELIGINTAILAPGGGNVGIGFAVPINMAHSVMQQIIQHGDVRRGRIGISTQDLTPDLAEAFHTKPNAGAVIAEVAPRSPAEQAGIRKGDVVIAANGVPIRSSTQLRNKIGLTPVGDRIELEVERNGMPQKIPVRVGPPQ
ncbi:MAG TPA: Do family serine endopeptidase [Xanthobacteraceae bacterium]|jgi:serine protease Do|nr:Do family serine endopeptidase [Xanthobacteraceae bacterium]